MGVKEFKVSIVNNENGLEYFRDHGRTREQEEKLFLNLIKTHIIDGRFKEDKTFRFGVVFEDGSEGYIEQVTFKSNY